MHDSIREQLARVAHERWGSSCVDQAIQRSEPLSLEVALDPDDPRAETIPVAIDDPGAFIHQVWLVLEALVAGGLMSGQAVLDPVRVRYWRAGVEYDDATLVVQVGLEGEILEAECEVMIAPGTAGEPSLFRSAPFPVRALCDTPPVLPGTGG